MEQVPVVIIFVNLASVCILAIFGLIAFMGWYLRKHVDEDHQQKVRNSMWLETMFYYRDLTGKSDNPIRYAYPLALFFLFVILLIFCVNLYRQLWTLAPLLRYIISFAVLVVIGILAVLFRRLSLRDYL